MPLIRAIYLFAFSLRLVSFLGRCFPSSLTLFIDGGDSSFTSLSSSFHWGCTSSFSFSVEEKHEHKPVRHISLSADSPM
ncbi:hypothetical protein AMTRI_Chr12g236180 [Amborella trichopoda]